MRTNAGIYTKAIFAALMAVLTTLYGFLNGPDSQMTDAEWVAVVLAGVTAVGVYLFPNSRRSDQIPPGV